MKEIYNFFAEGAKIFGEGIAGSILVIVCVAAAMSFVWVPLWMLDHGQAPILAGSAGIVIVYLEVCIAVKCLS